AEERSCEVDRRLLDLVDDLAAAVVALARKALGVLVRRRRADRLEDRRPREVLRGDELDLAALAVGLALEERGDLRVDVGEAGGAKVVDRFLRYGHCDSFASGQVSIAPALVGASHRLPKSWVGGLDYGLQSGILKALTWRGDDALALSLLVRPDRLPGGHRIPQPLARRGRLGLDQLVEPRLQAQPARLGAREPR